TPNQRILAPFGPPGQSMQRRSRLDTLAHALEWLVITELQQRIESGRLCRLVEQVAPEDRQQSRLGHERRQREKHETAFRALPAPAAAGLLAENVEIPVAAGEHAVVAVDTGETLRHRQFRQR